MLIKKHKLNLNTKGFSLIELMIVVAIIGLLAAIGIPQYAKFQAKSRQAEAKGSLSALYTAEVSFMSEWNAYTVNLKNIGFGVTGSRLRYKTGFTAAACANYPAATTGVPQEAAAVTNTWSDGTLVNVNNPATFGPTAVASYFAVTMPVGTVTACDSTDVANKTFTAAAIGNPNNQVTNGTAVDGWTITQSKIIANPANGIQ